MIRIISDAGEIIFTGEDFHMLALSNNILIYIKSYYKSGKQKKLSMYLQNYIITFPATVVQDSYRKLCNDFQELQKAVDLCVKADCSRNYRKNYIKK